jgi:hypothetical protein
MIAYVKEVCVSSQEVSGERQEPSALSSLASGLEFTRKNFDNPALEDFAGE